MSVEPPADIASRDAPPVKAGRPAREFVQDNGGEVFVWTDDAGLKQVSLDRPDDPIAFTALRARGLTLSVDPAIDPPIQWEIVLRHLPHRHIDAVYNGSIGRMSSPITDPRI